MTKRIVSICIAAVLVVLGCISIFAAGEPQVTADAVCYVNFNAGSNDYDGLTADTAKKQLLGTDGPGAIGILKDGGTMVGSGKIYIGGDYLMPELGSTLKITSNDGKMNYKNSMPIDSPACCLKMKAGAVMTLQQDTIIDDIILFQENAMNTIKIANNSTLLIGDKVECISNILALEPCYMAIEVEEGSTVILNGGTFQQITGDGKVINNGATIVSESAESTDAPEATTKAPDATTKAPDTTTKAPDTTTKAPDTTTKAPDTTTKATTADEKPAVATSGDATTAPEGTTAAVTTAATSKTSADSTKAPEKTTAPAASSSETTTAPAATEEGGVNVGLIIGIVAAVIVVAVVVIVIVTKKKK